MCVVFNEARGYEIERENYLQSLREWLVTLLTLTTLLVVQPLAHLITQDSILLLLKRLLVLEGE